MAGVDLWSELDHQNNIVNRGSVENELDQVLVQEGAGGHDHGLRRGPWTLDEDTLLIRCIASYGEGRWNMIARCSGLKRTGKSCRLRWLNYLKPDVKRGNLTLEEQLLILELHSKWGNRWSRIAQHLPGRTDNEIKNYWRTSVQKQAKQLQCDANSLEFRETMRCVWIQAGLNISSKMQGADSKTPNNNIMRSFTTSEHPSIIDQILHPISSSSIFTSTPPQLQISQSPSSSSTSISTQQLRDHHHHLDSHNSPNLSVLGNPNFSPNDHEEGAMIISMKSTTADREQVDHEVLSTISEFPTISTPNGIYDFGSANRFNYDIKDEVDQEMIRGSVRNSSSSWDDHDDQYYATLILTDISWELEENNWVYETMSAATLWNMDEFNFN